MLKNILLLSFFLFGCVYFNTFYNAEQSYEKAVKIIEQSQDEDDLPSNAKNLLADAIHNSQIVLERYPDSKYIDDAFYIIGKASFYRKDNNTAEKYFTRLISEFPDSPHRQESRIWLTYTHYRMGMVDESLDQIKQFIDDPPKEKNLKYILYKVMGEIELTQDSIASAFDYFESAAKFADTDSKRMSIYNKLLLISESRNDYEKSVYILEQIELYSRSAQTRQEAKMKWIEYNRILGNYDLVLTEIDDLLSDPDYDLHHLPLELEKGKIALAQKDYSRAREYFQNILENTRYRRKDPTAEASYHLGNLAITDGFDLDLSIMYLDSVSQIFRASLFMKKAGALIRKINKYQSLEVEYDTALQKLNETDSDSDSSAVVTEPIEEPADTDSLGINIGKIPGSIPNDRDINLQTASPDSLLFTIAEMLLFEFNKPDLSKRKYEELVENFPDSKFIPQSLYVLSQLDTEGQEKWSNQLIQNFPESIYTRKTKGEDIKKNDNKSDPLKALKDEAWQNLQSEPAKSRDMFLRISTDFNDPESGYFAAYITDKYLYIPETAINQYQKFLTDYPDSKYVQTVAIRLDELKQAVREKMNEVVGWVHHHTHQVLLYAKADTIYARDGDQIIYSTNIDSLGMQMNSGSIQIFAASDTLWKYEVIDSTRAKKLLSDIDISCFGNSIIAVSRSDTLMKASAGDTLLLSGLNSSFGIYPQADSLSYKLFDDEIIPHPELDEIYLQLGLDEENAAVDSLSESPLESETEQILSPKDTSSVQPAVPAWMDSLRKAVNDAAEPEAEKKPVDAVPPTMAVSSQTVHPDKINPEPEDTLTVLRLDTLSTYKNEEFIEDSAADDPATESEHFPEEKEVTLNLSEYITEYGDNLKSIARKAYNDESRWQDIYILNKSLIGNDPNRIIPYLRIYLEGDTEITKKFSVNITMVVTEGESLWTIAEKMYGDPFAWSILYQDNIDSLHDNENLIQPGMILRIRSNLH